MLVYGQIEQPKSWPTVQPSVQLEPPAEPASHCDGRPDELGGSMQGRAPGWCVWGGGHAARGMVPLPCMPLLSMLCAGQRGARLRGAWIRAVCGHACKCAASRCPACCARCGPAGRQAQHPDVRAVRLVLRTAPPVHQQPGGWVSSAFYSLLWVRSGGGQPEAPRHSCCASHVLHAAPCCTLPRFWSGPPSVS